jgi:hypothetical protein
MLQSGFFLKKKPLCLRFETPLALENRSKSERRKGVASAAPKNMQNKRGFSSGGNAWTPQKIVQ